MARVVRHGGIGPVREQQRQALERVCIGGNLQQRSALRQPQIRIRAGIEQLLQAGRVVARCGQRQRRPAAVDLAGMRGIELAGLPRRSGRHQVGAQTQRAQLHGGGPGVNRERGIERVVATAVARVERRAGLAAAR